MASQGRVVSAATATIVREEHDNRVIEHLLRFQAIQHLTNRRVHAGDRRPVVSTTSLRCRDRCGGAIAIAVGDSGFRLNPWIHRFESFGCLHRGANIWIKRRGIVRCVEGNVQKERFFARMFIQEPQSLALKQVCAVGALVLFRWFEIADHAGHAVTFVREVIDAGVDEAVKIIEATRGGQHSAQGTEVPFAIDSAFVTCPFQHGWDDHLTLIHSADTFKRHGVLVGGVAMTVVGGFVADHVVDPVSLRIPTRQQAGPRRSAGWPRHIEIRQPCSLVGKTIQSGRDDSVAQLAQIVVALIVRNNQQDVRAICR